MEETSYALRISVPVRFEDAVARATDALKSQGFGVKVIAPRGRAL